MLPYSFSFRPMMAIAAAAFIASAISVFTAATEPVEASASLVANRGELATQPIGPACAQQAWPYYERHCVRDLRPQTGQTQPTRTVTIDLR